MKLSKLQQKVLDCLGDGYDGDEYPQYDEDVRYYQFKTIAEEEKITIREARLACRALKRKGLAQYHTLTNEAEDYRVWGSGYAITREGAKHITPPSATV